MLIINLIKNQTGYIIFMLPSPQNLLDNLAQELNNFVNRVAEVNQQIDHVGAESHQK